MTFLTLNGENSENFINLEVIQTFMDNKYILWATFVLYRKNKSSVSRAVHSSLDADDELL